MKTRSTDKPPRCRMRVEFSPETQVALHLLAKRLNRKRHEAIELAILAAVRATEENQFDPQVLSRIETKLDEVLRYL